MKSVIFLFNTPTFYGRKNATDQIRSCAPALHATTVSKKGKSSVPVQMIVKKTLPIFYAKLQKVPG